MSLRVLAFTVLSLLAVSAAAEVPIERAMSAEERAATGFDQPSAEQLAALDAWLAGQRAGASGTTAATAAAAGAAAPTPVDNGPPLARHRREHAETAKAQPAAADDGPPVVARVRDQASGADQIKRVDSRLVGSFNGWREGQLFVLENGQHWQGLERKALRTRSQSNPGINLRRSLLGSWLFRINGLNRSMRVERSK